MRSPLLALLVVLPGALLASQARAGAWVREPGGWFLKLGVDSWVTDQRFDPAGRRVDYVLPSPGAPNDDEYSSRAFRVYGEYGLAEGWTLAAGTSIESLRSRIAGVETRNTGFGDLRIEVERRLLAAPLAVTAIGGAKLPIGYDATASPALGTGASDVGARLAVGASTARLYASAEAGYAFRGAEPANETVFALEAGVSVRRDVMIRGQLRGSMSGGTLGTPAGRSFDPALADSRILAGGAGLVLRGTALDLVFEAEHVLAGRNALAGTRYSFSVWAER